MISSLTRRRIHYLLSKQMIGQNNRHHRFTDRVDSWNGRDVVPSLDLQRNRSNLSIHCLLLKMIC